MNEGNSIWRLFLAALPVLPMTRRLAEEQGGRDPFTGFRARFGPPAHHRFMGCFHCLSLWLSLPLVVWLSGGWIGLLAHCQTLSGVACLLEKARLGPQPAIRAILAETEMSKGESSCGLVKSEAG
jgi:hypothetical protein